MGYIIALVILTLILVFIIKMLKTSLEARKTGLAIRKKVVNRVNEFEHIFALSGHFEQEGLPIPREGVLDILLCNDKIVILDATHDFVINKQQIHEVKYNVERKVQKELQTSTAKGIVGAAVAGTAGAVIGSQPKQKTISNIIISELSIRYTSSQGADCIVKFRYRTIGDSIPNKMKEFEKKAYEILLRDKIASSGTIEL